MLVSQKISGCRVCASNDLIQILDLGIQPPANSLRRYDEALAPAVPLELVMCSSCNTVQLSETVDPRYLFSRYLWVTGTAKNTRQYSEVFCEEVFKRSAEKIHPFVLEIASNDGTFLKCFQDKGCKVLGIDPAQNIAQIANDNGIHTWPEFFDRSVAEKAITNIGNPDIVIARNVIPHVKEIHSMVEGISVLLDGGGVAIIEFHYVQSILEELHYDSIYHEHLFYFSLETIGNLLARFGILIFDVTHSPISGGSLVIYCSKTSRKRSEALLAAEEKEKFLEINKPVTWTNFAKRCQAHAIALNEIIVGLGADRKIVGYGASARSSTLLNFCALNHSNIDKIVDKNPLKTGLMTPGSNIEIVGIEYLLQNHKNFDVIIILAWNFAEEIKLELANIGYVGSILLPLPNSPSLERLGR